MEPTQRMMVIRLLEKIDRDAEMARRLMIANVSDYRKVGRTNEKINKE